MDNTITNFKAILPIAKYIAFYKNWVDLLKHKLRLMFLQGVKLLCIYPDT